MVEILALLKKEARFSEQELKRVSHSIDHLSLDADHRISWLEFLELFSNAAMARDQLHNKAIHRATTMRLNTTADAKGDGLLRLEGSIYRQKVKKMRILDISNTTVLFAIFSDGLAGFWHTDNEGGELKLFKKL